MLAPALEKAFMGGNYRTWLQEAWGVRYDQRNSLVVGFAMGFAVIPIIFTISEDALSSVPKALTSASLACGASAWQTAWRVVLPTGSPGIFSAVMVGVGRAIGETMIVLMATGNTPILDWGPFNGMRTLSANIAVEIPEAPHHGTLYRILFLAALLLFILTFSLNTIAELVRQHLRKKYESHRLAPSRQPLRLGERRPARLRPAHDHQPGGLHRPQGPGLLLAQAPHPAHHVLRARARRDLGA
jgi:phosphate transport system permease protein